MQPFIRTMQKYFLNKTLLRQDLCKPKANAAWSPLFSSLGNPLALHKLCVLLLCCTTCVVAACQSTELQRWPLIDRFWPTANGTTDAVTEITLMGWSTNAATDQRLLTLINQFNEEQPEISASLKLVQNYDDALRTARLEDTSPDLFMVDSFQLPDFVHNQQIEAVADYAARQGISLQIDAFYPQLITAFTVNETLYCLPAEFSTLALLYNKALFDEAQINYPSDDWSWQDLRTAAEAISKIPTTFFSVSGLAVTPDLSRWAPFLFQAGGSVLNEEATQVTINSPASLNALTFYLGLALDGLAVEPQNISSSWSGEAFGKGRVGMIIEGNWVIPYLEEEFPNLSYGVAPLPVGPSERATLAFSHCYAVSSASPHQDEAFQLSLFLTSQNAMRFLNEGESTIPARVALQSEWLNQYGDLRPFIEGITHAQPWQFGPNFQEVVIAVNSAMQQVLDAEITAEEVLRVADVVGTAALTR